MQQQVRLTLGSRILVAASWGLGDLVESMGGDRWRVLKRADVKPTEIQDPLGDISVRQHCALFESAARETGAADFGMRFGQALNPRNLGPIGYLAASAPTLRVALETLCQYHPAHQSGALLSLSVRDDAAVLSYRICDSEVSEVRQETEMTIVALCNIIKHALGPRWIPEATSFAHTRMHSGFNHANVCFGRMTNSILFRAAQLDTPMPSPDPYLMRVMSSLLGGRRVLPSSIVECVRQRIELCLEEGVTTLPRVAAQMGIRESRLAAELVQVGTSFSELLANTRCSLALRYLRDDKMPLTDIALRLGYSELSAFSRAFHKWVGTSPQAYRTVCKSSPIHGAPC